MNNYFICIMTVYVKYAVLSLYKGAQLICTVLYTIIVFLPNGLGILISVIWSNIGLRYVQEITHSIETSKIGYSFFCGLGWWCSTLMPLSTLFQLYRGGQFNAILKYQRVIGGIAYHHFS